MRPDWLPLLRCPVTGAAYDLDPTRASPDDVIEGFLVARGGRAVRPIVQGIAVLPRELRAHLRAYGHVYARVPLADSRVVRFVQGGLGPGNGDRVPFEEVVARYGDLVPPGTFDEPSPMAPEDADLAALLAAAGARGRTALDVGCGVGRGVFVLRERYDAVLGVDRSVARLRRARNVATTKADFFLPAPPGDDRREVPIDLHRLEREGCDFAVADPTALPIADGALDAVVLRARDGTGPYEDRAVVLQEAVRVLAADGLLVTAEDGPRPDRGWGETARQGALQAWRRA